MYYISNLWRFISSLWLFYTFNHRTGRGAVCHSNGDDFLMDSLCAAHTTQTTDRMANYSGMIPKSIFLHFFH